ncbi:Ras GTPase activating protein ira2 [Umbelopsis nana]
MISQGLAVSGNTRLILGLVNRITARLPVNNGSQLHDLESDPTVQQTVAALTELSEFRLPTIAKMLASSVENLYKAKRQGSQASHRTEDTQDDENASLANRSESSEYTLYEKYYSIPRPMYDPPPLDDELTDYLSTVLSPFLFQMQMHEDKTNNNQHTTTPSSPLPKRPDSITSLNVENSGELIVDIYQTVRKIFFYTSASNWTTYFARIRTRLTIFAASSEEMREWSDLRLIECASLNSKRLGQVLREMTTCFLHLSSNLQLRVAIYLRNAIWNWIELYTVEFVDLCVNSKRTDSGPEILFDMAGAIADNTRKRSILWPLQTMLLVLCPDILLQSFMSDVPSQATRRGAFLEILRKSLRNSKTAGIAAACYVDICKTSTFVPPTENCVLRHIAADIENELREKVFDFSRPTHASILNVSMGLHIDQQKITTDFMLSLFRLDARSVLEKLVPSCLDDQVPISFKLSLIKACSEISESHKRLPWYPMIMSMHSYLAAPMRRLFLDYAELEILCTHVVIEGIPVDRTKLSSLKRLESQTTTSELHELLLSLLQLFSNNPLIALLGDNDEERALQNAALILKTTQLLSSPKPQLRNAAMVCLNSLLQLSSIANWDANNTKVMSTFWKISSQAFRDISLQILQIRENEELLKQLLELQHKLMQHSIRFLNLNQDIVAEGADIIEAVQMSIFIEAALLVSFASLNTEVCSNAIECLQFISNGGRMMEDLEVYSNVELFMIQNMSVYEAIMKSKESFLGRKAQQKRIRECLRVLSQHTPGILGAWEEIWERWKILSQIDLDDYEGLMSNSDQTTSRLSRSSEKKLISPQFGRVAYGKPYQNMTKEERAFQWQNYTGFLAAVGGCLLTTSQKDKALDLWLFTGRQPIRSPRPSAEYHAMIKMFVMELFEHLISDNIFMRETAKEALGRDLSPVLHAMLLEHMEDTLSQCFESDGDVVCSPRYNLLIDQSITVLKLILDRINESSESLFAVNFSGLIHQFAKYLNKLGPGQTALKMKIRMCNLCEALMQKKEYVTIRQEYLVRNRLLEIIAEWTSDCALKPESRSVLTAADNAMNEKLYHDLDQACLKTIVALLHQLPLQPLEPVQEGQLGQVKSRIFYKYFTFFLKLLHRCKKVETRAGVDPKSPNGMKATRAIENPKDLEPLKNSTILAMSNLLSANVDAGLKYSLTMGYHEDTRTRAAFMQVLTNILKQGTEFDTLAEDFEEERNERLVKMLVESDLNITLALCEVCPAAQIDEVAEVLMTCFESRNKHMELLETIIAREVASTEQEATLFRSTNITTRMISLFTQSACTDYLHMTLQPALEAFNEIPAENTTWELDPEKVGQDEDIAKNKENVIKATEMLLTPICDSVKKAPNIFREVLNLIVKAVQKRYPEAKYTAAGGIVFLRFFCPAILTPEGLGMPKRCSPKTKEIRKLLVQATKVIQNLANNVLFGAKETHMIVLNDYLTTNIYRVTNFLRDISTPPTLSKAPVLALGKVDKSTHIKLHRLLFNNLERMSRHLAAQKMRKEAGPAEALELKKMFDSLSNLLFQFDKPAELPREDSPVFRYHSPRPNEHVYSDLIRRNENRSLDALLSKNIFYEGGASKAGRPVFYFITRRCEGDNIDFELLLYYMMKQMTRTPIRPFEIVFDNTQINSKHEFPGQWLNQVFGMMLHDVIERVATLYIYNPSTYSRTYFRKFNRNLITKLVKKTVSVTSLAEIHEYIPPSKVRLPQATVELDTQSSVVFYPVNRLAANNVSTAVTIKVGPTHIQIMTTRKQELIYGYQSVINDVFHISDVDVTSTINPRFDESNEFTLKIDSLKASMAFVTPRKAALIALITHNKKRFNLAKPTTVTERVIRPEDVPGRLLNMALLNIGSDDPDLRLAAYNLLYSLSLSFRFDVSNRLLNSKDHCIPANSTSFIVGISENLAVTEPHLTLEFLNECFVGFNKSSETLRQLCLEYMAPWLQNLSIFARNSPDGKNDNVMKTKEVIRLLIDLTVTRVDIYRLVQDKVWKTIGQVDDVINLVLDTFVQFSVEHGIGSPQAETMADTLVTLSNIAVKGKIIARLRRVVQKTSFQYCKTLTEHPAWIEIATLVRFTLMLSFHSTSPIKPFLAELMYIVTILVATGPTLIRTSIHGMVVNILQLLSTEAPLSEGHIQKLHFLANDISESKNRVLYGITEDNINAFTISRDTLTGGNEPISLESLEAIVKTLIEAMSLGASTIDTCNTWRARWMGLVTSTAFQFNPAIQPRAFIVIGCLAQDEVDDDLVYQILVALRGALQFHSNTDSNLLISILMCLKNIAQNMPPTSRYLLPLFWIAVALVEINDPAIFAASTELLAAIVQILDHHRLLYEDESIVEALLKAREPFEDAASELDRESDVNFTSHFSFAIVSILLKGIKHENTRPAILRALCTFLRVERKHSLDHRIINPEMLGYLVSLMPLASRDGTLRDVLRLAGIDERDIDHARIFEKIDIPDNTTALLMVSLLVNMLSLPDMDVDRVFIYGLLAEAAAAIPEVFGIIYDTLLPKMNQLVLTSQETSLLESVHMIMLTACSEPAIQQARGQPSQKSLLNELQFGALVDPTLGATNFNPVKSAKLASTLVESIIS